MKCVIYVRVSTDEQAKEGFSIAGQTERLRAFASSQGWTVIDEYIEEGWSAKDLKRPKMQQLLKDIDKNEIDVILVYRLDRLTRSVLDLYQLLKTFEEKNVAFRSATEVYDTSTAMGRLFLTLVAALAQWERENLAERVKFGMEQMIDEGKKAGGHLPFGYTIIDGEVTTIEKEAAAVKKIFDMYIEGYGYRAIADRLNNTDLKPRIREDWSPHTVRSMLINDSYIGMYNWGDKKIESYYPPIIDELLFRKAQSLMGDKTPKDSRKGKNVLTGILKCGSCDESPMSAFYDKRDNKNYYRCLDCRRATPDFKIIDMLLDELERLIASKEYFIERVQTPNKNEDDFTHIKDELKKIKEQKDKLLDLYMDENNPFDKDEVYARINKLNKQEQELKMKMMDIDVEGETPEQKYEKIKHLTDIKNYFHKVPIDMQKDLLASIFEKVVVTRDKGRNQPIKMRYSLK